MILKTLDVLGPLARVWNRAAGRADQQKRAGSESRYPGLLKRLTREGRKQLEAETKDWEQTQAIIGRFFEVQAEDLS